MRKHINTNLENNEKESMIPLIIFLSITVTLTAIFMVPSILRIFAQEDYLNALSKRSSAHEIIIKSYRQCMSVRSFNLLPYMPSSQKNSPSECLDYARNIADKKGHKEESEKVIRQIKAFDYSKRSHW